MNGQSRSLQILCVFGECWSEVLTTDCTAVMRKYHERTPTHDVTAEPVALIREAACFWNALSSEGWACACVSISAHSLLCMCVCGPCPLARHPHTLLHGWISTHSECFLSDITAASNIIVANHIVVKVEALSGSTGFFIRASRPCRLKKYLYASVMLYCGIWSPGYKDPHSVWTVTFIER